MSSFAILKSAQLKRRIETIGETSKRLNESVHQLGLNALYYVGMHGDITHANRLVEVLHEGVRRIALIEWFCTFGQLKQHKGEDGTISLKYDKSKKDFDMQVQLDLAEEVPFWKLSKEKPSNTVFDVVVMMKALIKTAQDKAKKEGNTVKHLEALPQLQAMVDSLESAEVLPEAIEKAE